MKPTMYLRVQERLEPVTYKPHAVPGARLDDTPIYNKRVRVVQQFWEHANGKETTGDMFVTIMGSWHDLPLVRA